jgi:hypothetical protein
MDLEADETVQRILDRIAATEKQRLEALFLELHSLANGNPGSLFAGMELHKARQMSLDELVPLLRSLGLLDSAFYLLHKEFGGKDPARTAEILRALATDPDVRFPRCRGGELHPVVEYCVAEMRRYV